MAVADSLWVSAKPEQAKIGWTYDFDQTERLSRAAEKATGYEVTMEVVAFVMAEADRRHKSALSQPHPADERVVEALREAEETLQLVEHPAFPDPLHHDEVKRLGRRIGFGALMSTASAAWREDMATAGHPTGGEFVAGPCHSTVVNALSVIRAALAQEGRKNG